MAARRKAQNSKIKEELLPIAWHPNRVKDWCMSEDEVFKNYLVQNHCPRAYFDLTQKCIRINMTSQISDHLMTQEMWHEVVDTDPDLLECVPDHFKNKKCVKKLLRMIHICSNMSQIIIRPKTCVILQYATTQHTFFCSCLFENLRHVCCRSVDRTAFISACF